MSRQFEHLKRKTLDRLRQHAGETPLAIGYDAERQLFTVCFTDDTSMVPLIAGRFQVVHAWIDGFVRGYINRPIDAQRT